MSISDANRPKSVFGSEHADNTKIKGVRIVESLKHFAISKTGGIVNSFPYIFSIHISTAGMTLSVRIAFKTINL